MYRRICSENNLLSDIDRGNGCGFVALPSIELVLDFVGLTKQLRDADLVMTDEKSLNAQNLHDKAPVGIAEVAASVRYACNHSRGPDTTRLGGISCKVLSGSIIVSAT